jgi:hypothetical protein
LIPIFLGLLLLSSCSNFEVKNIAKSDTDLATDQHIQQMTEYLKELTVKLYKRNPNQLRKAPRGETIEDRISQIFDQPGKLVFDELQGTQEIDAMLLAFDESFDGDRVFALMTGCVGMIRKSYEYKPEVFFLDKLDPDKLYKSARNIEVMSWKLRTEKDQQGRQFLITSESGGRIDNLSFERLYGKIIGQQDILAKVIADDESRSINFLIHSGASMVFLPF